MRTVVGARWTRMPPRLYSEDCIVVPSATEERNRPYMMRKLMERRVPQILGLYVAAGWGFVQFVDWAVHQYALSPDLVNFVAVLLLLLLPSVLWLAWRHGAPGRDGWRAVDGGVVAGNLVAAAGTLILAFAGRELGAATTVRLLEDDQGNVVERVVPRAAFRKSVLVFAFDNASADPERDWLGGALEAGLFIDLEQDPFVTPFGDYWPTVRDLLQEAGVAPNAPVPLPLKRQAAELLGVEHFMDGEFRSRGDTLVLTTRLYRTVTGRQVVDRTYRGEGPLPIIDRVSVDLRLDLGIPDWQVEEAVDLPAAELLTRSPEALQALSEAERAFNTNDWSRVREAAERAAELDSTAALAHLMAGQSALMMGDRAGAAPHLEAASRFDWRLPESMKLMHRMFTQAMFQGDFDAAAQTGSYWAEVYPEDIKARRLLAFIYSRTGDREAHIRQLRALLSIDPTDPLAAQQLASAYRLVGRFDSALVVLRRAAERVPSNVQHRIDIANTLRAVGDPAGAREELEAARVAAPGDVDVLYSLARLDLETGRIREAEQAVEEAGPLLRADEDRYRFVGLEESIAHTRGQFERLEALYWERLRLAEATRPLVNVVAVMPNSEVMLFAAQAGREEFALRQLDSLRSLIDAPQSHSVDEATVRIHIERGELEALRDATARLAELRDASGGNPYRSYVTWAEAWIAELEDGNCERALADYEEALRRSPRNRYYRQDRARCLRELGRLEEAGADIEWLLDLRSGYPEYRVEAARYFLARGEREIALAHLDAALETWAEADPEFLPAHEARALREQIATGD